MNKLPINLLDLVPKEVSFKVAARTKPLSLCKWSLRVRAWAVEKYGPEKLNVIFAEQRISEIAEIAFFMLKEKDEFGSIDEFLDLFSSVADQIELVKALLGAVGIGEPELKKIDAALKNEKTADPKSQPKRKTGAKPSTL